MAKDKEDKKGNGEEATVETVKMIWLHKKVTPGEVGKVFGFPATANKDGFFVCDVPKNKVKNEMKRGNKLVLVETWKKRLALEEEVSKLYE